VKCAWMLDNTFSSYWSKKSFKFIFLKEFFKHGRRLQLDYMVALLSS